jgi:hypothetical protein
MRTAYEAAGTRQRRHHGTAAKDGRQTCALRSIAHRDAFHSSTQSEATPEFRR